MKTQDKTVNPLLTSAAIITQVKAALAEDVGEGDVTAVLIPEHKKITVSIIARETAVICGCEWATAAFREIDPTLDIHWYVRDGEVIQAQQILAHISGQARAILTAERTALNFLQTLSGTATTTKMYIDAMANTHCRLLDTRKTIPGMRLAQKYAVQCGGGYNHRLGLYDRILMKENHIGAFGSITQAILQARAQFPTLMIEIEVETIAQLKEALAAKPDIIMLDNFDLPLMREAVKITAKKIPLEISGNVTLNTIREFAATGVDFISVGALTKHVRAIDLSLRVVV